MSTRLCLALCVLCGGCAARPGYIGSAQEAPAGRLESDAPAADLDDARTEANKAGTDDGSEIFVDIDLSEHGITGAIRAPESVEARALDDGIELRGGDDFHMLLGRGRLDPLQEKAEIVVHYQRGFVAFLTDENGTVVWETRAPSGHRFHFFASMTKRGVSYHCRSGREGAASAEQIRRMLDACGSVDVVAEVDLPRAEPAGT